MSRFSYKTLILILLFLLIPIVLFLRITQRASPATAGWFNDSWNYRQRVDITNSSGSDLTDFQVSIDIGTSALIAAGKMQSDCDDIRITDQNGNLLPYWIDPGTAVSCNQTATSIWSKISDLSTSGQSIYVYYGNPSASPVQSGVNTFDYYQDFDTASSLEEAGFSSTVGTWTIENGMLKVSSSTSSSNAYWLSAGLQTNHVLMWDGKTTSLLNGVGGSWGAGAALRLNPSDGTYDTTSIRTLWHPDYTSTPGAHRFEGAVSLSNTNMSFVPQQNHLYRGTFEVNGTTSVNFSLTDIPYGGTSNFTRSGSSGSGRASGYVSAHTHQSVSYWDWFAIRKYASTPPTATPQSEEVGPGPIAYWKFDEGVGTTAYDSSSNKNNGVFGTGTGAPTWTDESQCVSGKCLYFDGTNDQITIPSLSKINTPYTVSFWIKPQKSNAEQAIVSLRGSNSFPKFQIQSNNKFLSYAGPEKYRYSSITSNLNNWQLVTYVVADGTNLSNWKIYINDQEKTGTSGGNTGTYFEPGQPGYIGSAGESLFYQGYLDDLKIYPYARSAAQIKADYATGLAGMSSSSDSSVNIGGASTKSLSDGLVGYWKFDEGVGTTSADSSGNNSLATFGAGDSSPSWGNGKYGTGTSFDGINDYATSSDLNSVEGLSSMSVQAWIKPNNITSDKKFAAKENVWYFFTNTCLGSNQVGFVIHGKNSCIESEAVNTGITLNQWSHVIAVYENNTTKLYLNGSLVDSAESITMPTSDYSFSIGAKDNDGSSFGSFFDGLIDEVRIYNRALSPTEVKQLYDYAPGPVGYWKFEEGVGTTAYDSSGNGNNGTLINSPTWTTGKIGKGLSLNGTNSYVNIPSLTWTPTQFTVGFWLKPKTCTSYNQALLAGSGWGQFAFHTTNACEVYVGTDVTNRFTPTNLPANTVTLNQWQYFVFTFDNNAGKFYKNGILLASKTGMSNPTTWGGFSIGSNASNTINGSIDEVRIYNYARTQKQILDDMSGSSPAGASAKVGTPLVHYKFDEGFGSTVNNSGIGSTKFRLNFGTGDSGPTWSNNGRTGKALSFDGSNDYTYFTNTGILPEFTYSVWIKPTSLSGKVLNGNSNSWNTFEVSGTTIRLGLYQPSIPTTTYWYGPNLTTGQWQHLVVTFTTGGDVVFYLNGKKTSTQSSGTSTVNGGINQVGGSSEYASDFHGLIDEVKIYNYALSADEVKQDYNQGSTFVFGTSNQTIGATTTSLDYCIPGDTSPCSPPIAEWKFDEGVGTTAYDSSGNNNNGVFGTGSSAPSWTTGKIGKSLRFDGTNDYFSTNFSGLNGKTSATYTFWTKQDTLAENSYAIWANANVLVELGSTSTYGADSNDIRIRWYLDSAWGNSHVVSNVIDQGQWTYWTITLNNGETKIYKNAKEVYSGTDTGTTLASVSGDYYFGYRSSLGGIIGSIDQVRIYNYARTPAQIAWDYNQGAPIGHWKLDECQGTAIHDSSGNANHGVLSVGASGTQTTPGTCEAASDAAWANGKLGKINSSLNFDGSDDNLSTLSSSSQYNAGWHQGTVTDGTFSLWAKTTNYTSNILQPFISSSDGFSGNKGVSFEFDSRSGSNRRIVFKISKGTSGNFRQHCYVENILSDNNWHQWTVVVNSTSVTFYKDGTRLENPVCAPGIATGTTTGNTTYPLSVSGNGQSGYIFSGQIDDVRIYNYALTATQVKTLYNNGAVTFR